MKWAIVRTLFLVLLATAMFQTCEKEDDDDGYGEERLISTYSSDESHNHGQDCMNCHKQGGKGEGWFTVAGSVYDSSMTRPLPNATVRLYSGPNGSGTLIATLEVDKRGNFYTTASIDFGSGVYTLAEGSTIIKHMSSPISIGACNSCHGSIADRIWTK